MPMEEDVHGINEEAALLLDRFILSLNIIISKKNDYLPLIHLYEKTLKSEVGVVQLVRINTYKLLLHQKHREALR